MGGAGSEGSSGGACRIARGIQARLISCPPRGVRVGRRGDVAEAPRTAAEVGHGGRQVLAVEVGPRARREVELGIRALPQQEVAQPLLAARAHDEVDVRRAVGAARLAQTAREGRPLRLTGRQMRRGADDGVARGVVDGDAKLERAAAGRPPLGALDRRHQRPGQAVEDRKSTRLNSSHITISYAVFCLKKKKKKGTYTTHGTVL